MTTKRLLIWHNHSGSDSSSSPIAVHAWLEQGSQLNSALIQPKLCWTEVHKEEILSRNKSSIFNKTFSFHSIELLDITKIIPIDFSIDRKIFPFVRLGRSFIIEAFGGLQVMVFEARDEKERDAMINGMKMAVARLSSKIIVGDCSVLGEFYSPYGSVPGGLFQLNNDSFSY